MRVFLAGGTGAVGRRLVPLLVQHGHEVTATTRTPAKAAALAEQGATPAVLDALDADAVRDAVAAAGPEVVVHQLTALSGDLNWRRFDETFAATNELRTRGTDILLEAAARVGARRFVAQSFFSVTMPDPPASLRSTVEAMRHLERAVSAADGLEGVVLRYGGFYGPGTSLAADGEQVAAVRRRMFPVIGDGSGRMSFVHIDDVASATLAAIESDVTGTFDIVDDEPAPSSEWLPCLAAAVGAPPPRRLPVWLARLVAGDAIVAMSTRIPGLSNAEAKRALGWTPRWPSWREGFRHGLSEDGAWEGLAA
ncbi:MAG TPA: NAD(P)-dependent oxidoreductase [Gaiellaceae bacterium]|nr:NAD(P)-dependent oxidoreductase [Gaiellaceae bacterium]